MDTIENVSTHSRPKAAGRYAGSKASSLKWVSTHSRPKAAGRYNGRRKDYSSCFNTQPPEGGWRAF